jgi:hypothetical protein
MLERCLENSFNNLQFHVIVPSSKSIARQNSKLKTLRITLYALARLEGDETTCIVNLLDELELFFVCN